MRKRNSKREITSLLLLLFFWLCSTAVHGQEPEFTVRVSASRVAQNTIFDIRFELQNASGEDFSPPSFRDFKIMAGPSTGSSTVILNGKISRSQSWSYSLLASREGTFTIGPASIIAGRRKFNTKPVTIEVIPVKDLSSGSTGVPTFEQIILKAFVEPGSYYPGQQIVLQYKLLFRENIQSANTIAEDDYADFFLQPINSFSHESSFEEVNGVSFTSRIIKSVALYAHQSGRYSIDPMVLMVGINAPYPSNQGFFSMRRVHNVQVASEPLTIEILPLPPDQTGTGFSGAVGKYTLSTIQTSNAHMSTDDDFSIKIEIKGDGDPRRWDPPAIRAEGDFEIYEPRIADERTQDENGLIKHTRIIDYTIIPSEAGEYDLHIPFRFFNPDTKEYENIQSESVHLVIAQGRNSPRTRLSQGQERQARPLKPVSPARMNDRFWTSVPVLLLSGLLLSGAAWGLWFQYKKRKESEIPSADRLKSAASRHARHQLDQLGKEQNAMEFATFSENLTGIYHRFLSERFSIPPADLDLDKIPGYLENAHVPYGTIEEALSFFSLCLSLRYGGGMTGYHADELVQRCRHIIDLLDLPAQAPN